MTQKRTTSSSSHRLSHPQQVRAAACIQPVSHDLSSVALAK